MTDEIITYKGRPITELTREELIECVTHQFYASRRQEKQHRHERELWKDLAKTSRF